MRTFLDAPLAAYKLNPVISIPSELLEDCNLTIRVWTDAEWSQHVEDMRRKRRQMDKDGATWREKVRLTWRIKRAARSNPRFTWQAAK